MLIGQASGELPETWPWHFFRQALVSTQAQLRTNTPGRFLSIIMRQSLKATCTYHILKLGGKRRKLEARRVEITEDQAQT